MAYQKLQATRAVDVTPSDTVEILDPASGDGAYTSGNVLYVGTGGDLVVTTASGDKTTFVNIQDGTFIPVQVVKVWNTGTTAANIIALW
jgi:phosphoenolpyruvate synthase/pyruvate phosphate dikinase